MKDNQDTYSIKPMSESEFRRLSDFIHVELGIKLVDVKKTMLESRLLKRLRHLQIRSYNDYIDYLFSPDGIEIEMPFMIDSVTTNKTDFFREPFHFDFLVQTALPELIKTYGYGVQRKLIVWSAGCSSGEEPYTLTMVLSEFAEKYPGLGFNFFILATDISTRVLEKASLGIYEEERIDPVPPAIRQKYILRSKDRTKKLVRIIPELRKFVRFRRLNFMDGDFGFREQIDIIFCRNVIIYFDKLTQERLIRKFYEHLIPGGYLFMGHSETLFGMDIPLVQAAPTIYRKDLT